VLHQTERPPRDTVDEGYPRERIRGGIEHTT
jgi:hypothetical protein